MVGCLTSEGETVTAGQPSSYDVCTASSTSLCQGYVVFKDALAPDEVGEGREGAGTVQGRCRDGSDGAGTVQ